MTATEYIAKLQELIRIHGDLPVIDSFGEPMKSPEWNDDYQEHPLFILADKA